MMAPFSVAQLKEKASQAKSSSADKFKSVREKYTSRSSTAELESNQDVNAKVPPLISHEASWDTPHPPNQTITSASGPPPPIHRTTRPGKAKSGVQSKHALQQAEFKWSSITDEDKNVLFGWLDDFFDGQGRQISRHDESRRGAAAGNEGNEPRINNEPDFRPLRPEQFSAAEDLRNFFLPTTHWDTAWYSSQNPIPPPLMTVFHCMRMHTMQWRGNSQTLSGGVLFSDLSACWYTVTWANPSHDTSRAQRTTKFVPRPAALSHEELIFAHETYGETVAAFAEGYEDTGQWCARGECWDLASEGLKAFEQWDYIPKPLPSIGTTHGHLIFEGKAWGQNGQTGQWRGGDDCIRRGDIVQWKTVKIVDGSMRFTLGSPDHTAIVVRNQQPLKKPRNGDTFRPSDIGSLEVVEQSKHSPPSRRIYKLGGMISGEVWIYRPVGMEAYLKFSFAATCPEDLDVCV